jgi:hypothetical protein
MPALTQTEHCAGSDNRDSIVVFMQTFPATSIKVEDLTSSTSYAITIRAGSGYGTAYLGEAMIELGSCRLANCLICGSVSFCIKCRNGYRLQLNLCVLRCDAGFY